MVEPPRTKMEGGKKKMSVGEGERIRIWKWDEEERVFFGCLNLELK